MPSFRPIATASVDLPLLDGPRMQIRVPSSDRCIRSQETQPNRGHFVCVFMSALRSGVESRKPFKKSFHANATLGATKKPSRHYPPGGVGLRCRDRSARQCNMRKKANSASRRKDGIKSSTVVTKNIASMIHARYHCHFRERGSILSGKWE